MKKVLNIFKGILVWGVTLLAVAMMIFTIISVNTFDRNDRNLFGFKAFTVRTDSMKATDFDAGDIIFTKEVPPETLVAGDIIAFLSKNPDNYGETVTHKIREIAVNENGENVFVTYGTTTDTNDETPVTYESVLGKYVGKIPNVGTFFMFLKEPAGYILFIFIPFFLLILYQGINCVKLFKRYKKEQLDALNEEKKQIENDRAEAAKMLKELEELKAKLEGKTKAEDIADEIINQ